MHSFCFPSGKIVQSASINCDKLQAFVTNADSMNIEVKIVDSNLRDKLRAIGFQGDSGSSICRIDVSDNKENAEIFDKLRSLGVYFSAGREWCPSEVFEYLRDLGLISGKFQRISWVGGEYRVVEG